MIYRHQKQSKRATHNSGKVIATSDISQTLLNKCSLLPAERESAVFATAIGMRISLIHALCTVLLSLCLLFIHQETATAQEAGNTTQQEQESYNSANEAPESLSEDEFEIRRTEEARKHLRERLGLLDKRLTILKQQKSLKRKRLEVERQIEAAEERDAEPGEELEEQADQIEFESEIVTIRLELIDKRLEFSELRQTFWEEEIEPGSREFQNMNATFTEADKLINQLFKSISDGDDHEAEQIEIRLEELAHEFEVRNEFLHLQIELHHAKEEGEEEWIEELKVELRELQRELDGEGHHDDETKDTNQNVQRLGSNMPQPVAIDPATVSAAASWNYREHIEPLLKRHCHECHSNESASGDLNLMSLAEKKPWVTNRNIWQNISQQIRMRTMPPPESTPMPDTDRLTIASFLQHRIDDFDYETVRHPGYEPARRLTNEEYNHTIRDLFGMDLRPADRFPRELTASSGFSNSANSLFLQPVILERYLGAAEQVIQAAMPDRIKTAETRQVRKLLVGSRSAAEAITDFARRAFRRPVNQLEMNTLLNYYTELTEDNAESVTGQEISYRALGRVYEAILASPSFLIRHESNQSNEAGTAFKITDHELASRLSYFLWATMPDARLSQAADEGILHQPAVLHAEVKRMLADPNAKTLGEIFASEWLGFSALPHAPRDPIDNPWATDSLVEAMQQESALFFSSLVTENQPIERLIDANYTFVNAELARHYDLEEVSGPQMRRVSLQSSPRSGILGHGSILAITSFPNRTSPVVRGNWILSELLGTPPPPPPPNVSEFDDRVAERRNLTQRQKLELHRNNPNCYACHAQIDPLGFALEQYDWFGRLTDSRRNRQPDLRGKLPGGTEFRGLDGLQSALLADRRDQLVEQITRKMMTYALGRQIEYYDEAVIRDIIKKVEADNRRLQTLVHAIVDSETFQMKQIASGTED